VSLSRAKKNEDALREFVLALGYDPGHAEAKDYIRNKLKPPDWVYYTAVPGDTMAVIAKKAYQDEKRTFIVAGFNDLPVTAKVEPGQVFKLPIIESDLRKPSVNVNEVLGKAKTMLEQGNFDDAIATVESILVYDAGNAMARAMINTAYYNQGKAYQGANQPLEALTAFKNVEPGYKDTQAAMDTLQTALKASAEVEYKKGVEAFIKEDLNLAIAQWEVTLRMDPAHPKAQEDLQNARQLRDRLREVQQ
jgi:tetratricopeptide (TPR) repeat protein